MSALTILNSLPKINPEGADGVLNRTLYKALVEKLDAGDTTEFFWSLRRFYEKKGTFSEKQYSTLIRALCQGETRQPIVTYDVMSILEAFDRANDKREPGTKLKATVGSFDIMPGKYDDGSVTFFYRPTRKYVANVKRMDAGPIFSPTLSAWIADHVIDEAFRIACNFEESLVEHGKATGKCGICRRKLTRPESVARGIGPICASHYGFRV